MELFFIFLFGLAFGSFLNVLIYRVPKGLNIAYPPSHCPKCKNRLKFYQNIPLVSWIILKGECGYCKEKISIRYPLTEFTTALIFLAVFIKNGINIYSLIISLIFSLLFALSLIDFEYKAVPDSINLTALTLSIFSSPNILENIKSALILAGAFSFLRFFVSFYVSLKENIYLNKRKKSSPWLNSFYPSSVMIEAMGEGDIIVAGAIGAVLGIKLSIVAIFLSALFAIPVSIYLKIRKNEAELPYIPFLAIGFFITFIFDYRFQTFIDWIING